MSRSTQGKNLNKLGSTCIDNAAYKVSRSLVYWFWSRRLFKVFTIYGHGGHVGHVTQLICINFRSLFSLKLSCEFWFQIAPLFLRKTSFNFWNLSDLWPWRKMGQGQPRVIIWTTLVVLPYTMLHTKFQGHWSIGSGEEDFLRFLPYMGMAAMLVMWPRPFEQLFFPKGPGGNGPIGCNRPSSFRGEVVWNCGRTTDRRTTDDGRTTDNGACLYYKLPRSLRLRWAKNIYWVYICFF